MAFLYRAPPSLPPRACVGYLQVGYYNILPKSEDMQGRLIRDSKLPVGVNIYLYSCFQTCTELQRFSIYSAEGLYVWTQMSEWEPPAFLQTNFSSQPLGIKSTKIPEGEIWEHSKRPSAGFPAEGQKWTQTNILGFGFIHIQSKDKDVKRVLLIRANSVVDVL